MLCSQKQLTNWLNGLLIKTNQTFLSIKSFFGQLNREFCNFCLCFIIQTLSFDGHSGPNPLSRNAEMLQQKSCLSIYLKNFSEDTFLRKVYLLSREIFWKNVTHFCTQQKCTCIHLRDQLEGQYCFKGRNSLEGERQKRVLFVVGDSVLTSGRHSDGIHVWKIPPPAPSQVISGYIEQLYLRLDFLQEHRWSAQ